MEQIRDRRQRERAERAAHAEERAADEDEGDPNALPMSDASTST